MRLKTVVVVGLSSATSLLRKCCLQNMGQDDLFLLKFALQDFLLYSDTCGEIICPFPIHFLEANTLTVNDAPSRLR